MWHFVTKNTGLKSVKPGCQVGSPNREIPVMLVRQCVQNVSGKNGEVRPSGQNRRQKVFNRGALRLWGRAWHYKLTETPLIYSVSRFNLGKRGTLYRGLSPPKPPWRQDCFGLQSTPMEKRPSGRPRTRWSNYISGLACSRHGVEQAELSEIAVDSEVFWALLRLLPPRFSQKEVGTKMSKWICRPILKFSIYEIIFSLLANCECRIQIIKHIFRETCVFMKIKYQTKKGK